MKTWIFLIESIVRDILLLFFVIYRYVIWKEIKASLKKPESVMNMQLIEKQNIECSLSKNMEIYYRKYNFTCLVFEDNHCDLCSRSCCMLKGNKSGTLSKLFGSEHSIPTVFEKNNYFILIRNYYFSNRRYNFDVKKTFLCLKFLLRLSILVIY